LKSPGDDPHYVQIASLIVSVNTEADGAGDVATMLTEKPTFSWDAVEFVVSKYTIEEVNAKGKIGLQEEALAEIKEKYQTEAIVEISFEGFLTS
jgi:hypothetical protein